MKKIISLIFFSLLLSGCSLAAPTTPQTEIIPVNTTVVVSSTVTPSSATNIVNNKLTLKLYFNNEKLNPMTQDCAAVFPVERQVDATTSVAKTALNMLFAGPTNEEKEQGYNSIFSQQTANLIKSINLKDDVVYIDFNKSALLKAIESGANSSCGGAQWGASINKTLTQFKTIKVVKESNFSVEGDKNAYRTFMQGG